MFKKCTGSELHVAMCGCVILVASTPIYHQPKLMHLSEARLFNKFLAGASLLMSFHLGGHCRQGYDVTRSNLHEAPAWHSCIYHYHAHHPAAWSKISEYISNGTASSESSFVADSTRVSRVQ